MLKKIVFAFFFASVFSFAQAERGGIMSLDECIKIAEEKNFDIRIADARYKATDADVRAAFGQFLPSINYNFGYSRMLNESNQSYAIGGQVMKASSNSYDMSLGANLTIFDGFSREANYQRALDNQAALELSKSQTRFNVKFNVIRNYVAVVKASQIIKIRKENFEAGKKDLDRAQALYEAGTSTIANVYSVQAELANRELAIVQAENDFRLAKANLLTVIGLSPDLGTDFAETSIPFEFSKSDVDNFRSEIGDFRMAMTTALKNRFDYKAGELYISTANAQLSTAKAGYYPNLGVNAGWSWSNTELNEFSDRGRSVIGLNLSIPIFNQFRTGLNVENSSINLLQREIEQAQMEQSIKANVQAAFLNLESAEKQMEISEKGLFAAKQNYESANERFNAGATSIVEYQTANTTYITAQINKVASAFNYYEAQKQMLYAVGKLR